MSSSEEDLAGLRALLEEMRATPKTGSVEDLEDWMVEHLSAKGRMPVAQKEEMVTSPKEFSPKGSDDQKGLEGTSFVTSQAELSQSTYVAIPRLHTFSGEELSKVDVPFDTWKFDIECLMRSGLHSEAAISQAARRSLRGHAARTIRILGPDATIQMILPKMTDVYGVVDASETLLAEFYAAKQGR